jgi:hypothetical protein
MQEQSTHNDENEGFEGGRYARTEQELYEKAIALLEKCKVEDRRQGGTKASNERKAAMDTKRRRRLLERLNALDKGITEEDRRAERQAVIERTIETERALKWGRLA